MAEKYGSAEVVKSSKELRLQKIRDCDEQRRTADPSLVRIREHHQVLRAKGPSEIKY
jgi:hypothetical protein